MKGIRIRNFSTLNLNKIKENFIRSPILSRRSGDANRMVQSYQDVLTEIMGKHCPIKKKTFKPRPTSVWDTNDLPELKRKRKIQLYLRIEEGTNSVLQKMYWRK